MNTNMSSSENMHENPQDPNAVYACTPSTQQKSTENDHGEPFVLRSTTLNNINSFYRRRSARSDKKRQISLRKRLSSHFTDDKDGGKKNNAVQLHLKKTMKIKRRLTKRFDSDTANDADDEYFSNAEDTENKLVFYCDPNKKESDMDKRVEESDLIFFKKSVQIRPLPPVPDLESPPRCSVM